MNLPDNLKTERKNNFDIPRNKMTKTIRKIYPENTELTSEDRNFLYTNENLLFTPSSYVLRKTDTNPSKIQINNEENEMF